MPASVHRLSGHRAGAKDHRAQGARARREAGGRGGAFCRRDSQARTAQAAVDCGDSGLGARELDTDAVRTALGVLLKHEDDRAKVESKASTLAPRRKSAT